MTEEVEMSRNGRTRAERGLQGLCLTGSGFFCLVWVGREEQQDPGTQICCDSGGFSTIVGWSYVISSEQDPSHMARIMINCVILIVLALYVMQTITFLLQEL